MSSELLSIPKRIDRAYREEFARALKKIDMRIGFKISSRGWCYQLEQFGAITKAEFDKTESLINRCRREGLLPIDFVAQEEARGFKGVEFPHEGTIAEYLKVRIQTVLTGGYGYTPDWWEDEDYYIQMVVEKIDLVTLFEGMCRQYHIPIATSKGWSSMLQRAEYARRFQEAEEDGLKCVLLYCGDHDPDGLRIDNFLRENLRQISEIIWDDEEEGYDPVDLEIDRFGLNFDFIEANKLSWIENLITGSGKDLASPSHKNHYMKYVQKYIKNFGVRKCEANALVVAPNMARILCRKTIEKYLGPDATKRFEAKTDDVMKRFKEFRKKIGIEKPLKEALKLIEEEEKQEESEE